MKHNDRVTGTANVLVTGTEYREMRAQDIERWKRRVHRSIEAQKWKYDPETTSLEDAHRYSLQNEAYDMALKIVGAKFPQRNPHNN